MGYIYNAVFWSKLKVTASQIGVFVLGQHERTFEIDAFLETPRYVVTVDKSYSVVLKY